MIPREFHEYVASKMLEAFDAVIELRQIAVPGARSSFVKHAKERSALECENISDALSVAERQRDEARAASEGLREVLDRAAYYVNPRHGSHGHPAWDAERGLMLSEVTAALAATPAILAGQNAARVLREAATKGERAYNITPLRQEIWDWLRALADEAEKCLHAQ